MTLTIASEISFIEFFFAKKLKLASAHTQYAQKLRCVLSVCEKAAAALTKYAQKLLSHSLSVRQNVREAALYSECAHKQLLRCLSMLKSCCCAY